MTSDQNPQAKSSETFLPDINRFIYIDVYIILRVFSWVFILFGE